ncbi:MAG TPA: DinB family protein [Streptosporangiaceae bacterium]|jgi:hypothetical protein
MTDEPAPIATSPVWASDDRVSTPKLGGERELLIAFLEYHRRTFELKCLGVPPGRLSERGAPPSTMSLHGIVRHLAAVERWWFQIQFTGADVPMLYYTDDNPDLDFEGLDDDVTVDLEAWRTECAKSREITAAAALDDTGLTKASGQPFTLRWLLIDMATEYARHCGHADLLREAIDGTTGL